MAKLFYRREPFGAVLLNSDTDALSVLPPQLADCIEYKAAGYNDQQIRTALEHSYATLANVDELLLWADQVLRGSAPGNSSKGNEPLHFPTLSFPLDLFWEITRKCNENCMHCYNNSGPHGRGPTDEQLYSVVSELKNTKLRRLSVSGGEPLMRKGFELFVEAVRPIAYELSLSTNGTLINNARAEFIAHHFDDVNVSLDSPDELEFDQFRGLRGAFKKTIDGIRHLRKAGVTVVAQSVLTLQSMRRLRQLAELVAELDVTDWNIRLSFASGRGAINAPFFPAPAALFDVDETIASIKRDFASWIPRISGGVNYLQTYKESYRYTANPKRLVTCSGGTILAALSANGSLAPCPLFSETDYCSEPVWDVGFQTAWQAAACMKEMRTTTSDQIKGCGTCANLNGSCGGGCRAKSYLAKRTVFSNDYHCGYSKH